MRELELAHSNGGPASWMGTTAGQSSRSRVRVPSQIAANHAKRTENFTCYSVTSMRPYASLSHKPAIDEN
jgi:hypothetical protein